MINTWFISDTHFGHKKILEYEKEARPFSTIEEMHEVMIDRWNSVVSRKDVVYHLGDFAFGKHNIRIAERLNGKKKLIMGNHDVYPTTDYLAYFDKLYGVIFNKKCILSHVPVHPNLFGYRCILNIHGHLHSKNIKIEESFTKRSIHTFHFVETYPENKKYFNVSCEKNNLTPIHWDVIAERIKEINS